ncbi:hypothetical protein BRD01_03490 [Halobacteriales archaeon QS_8_65_32]|nr:MAG: hypothetical protein BRD01_03490 [Halobacteriales archaeon QS_8_65_32]
MYAHARTRATDRGRRRPPQCRSVGRSAAKGIEAEASQPATSAGPEKRRVVVPTDGAGTGAGARAD